MLLRLQIDRCITSVIIHLGEEALPINLNFDVFLSKTKTKTKKTEKKLQKRRTLLQFRTSRRKTKSLISLSNVNLVQLQYVRAHPLSKLQGLCEDGFTSRCRQMMGGTTTSCPSLSVRIHSTFRVCTPWSQDVEHWRQMEEIKYRFFTPAQPVQRFMIFIPCS